MRRRLLSVASAVLGALLVSACAPAGAEIAPGEEAIVRGARETGHPEVVALYWSSSPMAGGLCTGTVIGPYAVLTAKHCVFRESSEGSGVYTAVSPRDMVVVVGDDINSMDGIVSAHAVAEVRTTPGTDIDSDVESGNDIAIVLLTAAIPVAPRAVASSGPDIRESLTIVGFGRTSPSSSGSGVKYSGATTVTRSGVTLFETDGSGESWTCQGDSGGPAIDTAGAVVGITSFGFGNCELPYSYFTRVPAHRALVTAALTFVPPCSPVGETCNGMDDDCDDAVDEEIRCANVGDPCESGDDCIEGTCEGAPGAMVCVLQCFPEDPAVGCPAGQHCEVRGCGLGACVAGSPGAAPAGTECTDDLECASAYCATLASGTRRCGLQCVVGGPACAAGEACEPIADSCGVCIPAALSTQPRPFGEACVDELGCESGLCAAEGFCTRTCAAHAECGAGYHCAASGACARGPVPGGGSGGGCAIGSPSSRSARGAGAMGCVLVAAFGLAIRRRRRAR